MLGEKVEQATNVATSEDRIKEQLLKTGGTIFEIDELQINIQENSFISIKAINDLRRKTLEQLERRLIDKILRQPKSIKNNIMDNNKITEKEKDIKVNILLNKINPNYNYDNLQGIDNIYIHVSNLFSKETKIKAENLCKKFNIYIFLPTIIKGTYKKLLKNTDLSLKGNVKGFIISSISQIEMLEKYKLNNIANYTLNVFNNQTIKELQNFGFSKITISPELNKEEIYNLRGMAKEIIVYGRTLLMTSEYCPIGTFHNCQGKCQDGEYVLKDRMGFEFPIRTDRINCNTNIYNSKITSINWQDLNINSIRIDISNENIEEINNIIKIHKSNNRLEGQNYTNGNLNKEI